MTLINIIYYTCTKYSDYPDVGVERLQLTLYLVGWKTSLSNKKEVTTLDWVHGKDGPYSQKLDKLIETDNRIKISKISFEGKEKRRISLSILENVVIDDFLKAAIDDVFEKTIKLSFMDLTNLVYSTYPMLVTEKDASIPMETLAANYSSQKKI